MNLHTKILSTWVLAFSMSLPSPAQEGGVLPIPEQRFSVAFATTSWVRKTELTSRPGSSSTGLGLGYRIFPGDSVAIDGKFAIHLGAESELIIMGGAFGLAWYALGGSTRDHSDPFVSHQALPRLNIWLSGGLGFKVFDFTAADAAEEQAATEGTTVTVKDSKDVKSGSALGLHFELGANYPLSKSLIPGLSFAMFQSFESSTKPTLNTTDILLLFTFIL